ncbi:MAG: hypothetical protein CME68_06755 [Halobacteriovoraceae bacterium]|nr:hypothetical protein [Halobacteriovoraceae bacterium]|tara:strand:+ start:734 stop:1474 length:741 start_codon:yes stop_codon:yes gene_type:complete
MKSYFLLPLLVISLTIGCSKIDSEDIPQNEIYTDYKVSYDVQNDEVIARATFIAKNCSCDKISGLTRVKLSGDSFVTLNGNKLKLDGVIDKNLSLEYSGRLKLDGGAKEVILTYQNNDGDTFQNRFTLLDEPTFKVPPRIVEVGIDNHLEIEKDSLPLGESELYFVLKDDKLRTLQSSPVLNRDINSNGEASFSLKLDSSRNEKLSEEGEIGLCGLVKRKNIEKPEAGGLLSLSTCGRPTFVRILN